MTIASERPNLRPLRPPHDTAEQRIAHNLQMTGFPCVRSTLPLEAATTRRFNPARPAMRVAAALLAIIGWVVSAACALADSQDPSNPAAVPAERHPLLELDCRAGGPYDTETRLQELERWRAEAPPERPELHGQWLYCRATALEMTGELDAAYSSYSDAIEAYGQLPEPTIGAIKALLDRSYIDYLRSNDPARYCPDRTEALRLAREIGDPEAMIAALNQKAFCFARRPEQLAEGLALLEEALELARAEDMAPGELGMIYNATANLYRDNQLLEPALTYLELAYQAWQEDDDRQDMFNMLHGLIQTSTLLGRWDEAERHLQRMRELTQRSPGFADFQFFIEFNSGTLAQARGEEAEAIAAFDRAMALQHTTPERYFVSMIQSRLAELRFRIGDIETAVEHARSFLETADVERGNSDLLSAQSIIAFGEDQSLKAMQLLLDRLEGEREVQRQRMQNNAAGQAAIHNRRLEAFESTILRERLANRDLQLVQAQQAERNARLFNTLIGVTAVALLVLVGFLFWTARRFRDHARTDSMTGISNRRHVMEVAERLFGQSVSTGRALALLLLDIDHFKKINDQHGHDVGDRAIRSIAEQVADLLPPDALFGRVGGEEFMIVLPGHKHRQALALAESIRREVAERTFDARGVTVDLTLSIGVAEYTPQVPRLDELFRIADQALYGAKHQGRDRIVDGAV